MDVPASLRQALDREEDVALVLDRAATIRYVNPAWQAHAERDGAAFLSRDRVLGASYLDFIRGPIRDEVLRCLDEALSGRHRTDVLLHSECNTPETFRRLTSGFAPIRAAAGVEGVIVRHALRLAGPLARRYELTERAPESLSDARGLVVQCSCCRRIRDPHREAWLMSPALLARPSPSTSHGLCPSCLEIYFGVT